MVVKWCLAGTQGQRSCPPHHYTTSCSLKHWYEAGWIHVFIYFIFNSHPTIRKWHSPEKATCFLFLWAKFLWACANCNLSFLFLADRHGHSVAFCCCCRPSASRFNVLFIHSEMLEAVWPHSSDLWHLPENCSLDVFSFSHYSLWISEMFLWSAVSEIHQPDTNKPASFRVSSAWTAYILMLTSSWTGVLSEQFSV